MDAKNLEIAVNIIAGVETGGQIYGHRRYDAYAGPGNSTDKEVTCTLGYPQFYGNEGREFCRLVRARDPEAFISADNGAGIAAKLDVDWSATKWNPKSWEKAALIRVETTAAGKKIQDEYIRKELNDYENNAKAFGVKSMKAIMMWQEIEHLAGNDACKRIFGRTKDWTPEGIRKSLELDKKDPKSDTQAGDAIFDSRHDCCVRWINQYVTEGETVGKTLVANCSISENGTVNGRPGDSTGREYYVREWYQHNPSWKAVFRPKRVDVAEMIAIFSKAAALNEHIGYGQYGDTTDSSRAGMWAHCVTSDYDPAKITVNCNADCSSSTAAIVRCVGHKLNIRSLQNVPVEMCTSDEIEALSETGEFEKLTESKYLSSGTFLKSGDIEVASGHTNIICQGATDNPLVVPPEAIGKIEEVQEFLNTYYPSIVMKACGVLLDEDNDFGKQTFRASLAVWKYMANKLTGSALTYTNYNFFDSCRAAADKIPVNRSSNNYGTLAYIFEGLLTVLGYYSGNIDGDFGPGMSNAVLLYQERNNLAKNYTIDGETAHSIFNSKVFSQYH